MSLWKAMLQADLSATLLAGVGIDGAQLFSTALRGTFGPLMDFGVVGRIAVLPRVPLKHSIRVVRSGELHSFCTYWADDCARLSRSGLTTRMRLVSTVLQTEDLAAAITGERQKVYLLTIWDRTVRSQGEHISRARMVHQRVTNQQFNRPRSPLFGPLATALTGISWAVSMEAGSFHQNFYTCFGAICISSNMRSATQCLSGSCELGSNSTTFYVWLRWRRQRL